MNADQLLEKERLADWLQVHYRFTLKCIEPWGRAWKITTDQGDYCLKEVSEKDKGQWDFVAAVSHHLGEKEEAGLFLPEPLLTQSKKRTFAGVRCRYVLIPWIKGKLASFNSQKDWSHWSRKIALFHQSTRDFSNHASFYQKNSWHERWMQHLHYLEISHIAAKWTTIPTVSDQETLQSATYIKGLMNNLLEYDRMIEGEAVRKETTKHGNVCHLRLHRQHLIQGTDGRSYVVDPRDMAIDVRSTDLARWLIYAYRQTNHPEVLSVILRGYQQAIDQPLLKEEYALIYAHLLFPEKYCRLLEQIYIHQSVPIDEAEKSIFLASQREKQKLSLLKHYVDIVERDYGVKVPRIRWIHK